jgi:hypothetical protein
MNRSGQTVPGIVEHFKDKTGFIVWEFGIGRDNCRFTWDENREHPRKDETPKPFHGVVYPDGHPWSVDDVKALLGRKASRTRHCLPWNITRMQTLPNWPKNPSRP